MMKYLSNLKLKWRISLFITIILIILLMIISIVIYNNTAKIVKSEIKSKIDIVNSLNESNINFKIREIRRQLSRTAEESGSITTYLELLNNQYQKIRESRVSGEEIQSLSGLDTLLYSGMGTSNNQELNKKLENVLHAEFSYVVLPGGLKAADSRMAGIYDKEKLREYIGFEIEKKYYKDIEFGTVKIINDKIYFLLSYPIKNVNDEIYAHYVVGINSEVLSGNMGASVFEEGDLLFINKEGDILSHSNKNMLGTNIKDEWFKQVLSNEKSLKNGKEEETTDNYYLLRNVSENLYLAVRLPLGIIYSPAKNIGIFLIIISIIGISVIISLTILIISKQLKPLDKLSKAFNLLKEGNLHEELILPDKYAKRNDEIGILASSFNEMVGELKCLIKNIIKMTKELNHSTMGMEIAMEEIEDISQQVRNSVKSVSVGAETQAAQLEATTEKISDLDNQINEINKNSHDIDEGSDMVIKSIDIGDKTVKDSISKVYDVKEDTQQIANIIDSLGEMSAEIENIVGLIGGISEQTNLLALNAAIEAARAGEVGRGFSVVADEIRDLSTETSQATVQISDLIKGVQSNISKVKVSMDKGQRSVNDSVSVINNTSTIFDEIRNLVIKFSHSIKEITRNTENIAANSQDVNSTMFDIASVSQQHCASSEEIISMSHKQVESTQDITDSARELSKLSEELSNAVKKFNIEGKNEVGE